MGKLASSEFELIKKYFKPLTTDSAPAYSLCNDAAIYSPQGGKELIFTKDTLVAGVHFFENDPANLVAQKSLRVNLSDLASMGAEPLGYLLSISLPKSGFNRDKWLKAFSAGLKKDQQHYSWSLWGGDTVSTPGPLTISITAIGQTDTGQNISRASAIEGDNIYVSGSLGDAAAGLRVLTDNLSFTGSELLVERYHLPQPRLKLGTALIPLASSMMDISDGLMGDISHICSQSVVGARVYEQKIPISQAFGNLLETKNDYSHLKWCGGDDYELLFTSHKQNDSKLMELSDKLNIRLTRIGEITSGHNAVLIDGDGFEMDIGSKGFRHF